jgi:uncharacterized protein YprB with RNaseH-like and TPR domain
LISRNFSQKVAAAANSSTWNGHALFHHYSSKGYNAGVKVENYVSVDVETLGRVVVE